MEMRTTNGFLADQNKTFLLKKTWKIFRVSLLVFTLFNFEKTFSQSTPFTASWPLTTDLSAAKTGNVSVNNATYTAGTGGLFTSSTAVVSFGPSGLTGTGISGRGNASCDITYNSVTSLCSGTSGSINPFMEFVLTPNTGNEMTVNSLTFTVSAPNITTSGRVVAAGYSVDGGTTFTGFTPIATAGATANASPLSSTFSISSATTFSYSLPTPATVGNGSSLRVRILIWRNNGGGTIGCSGSSLSVFTIGALSVGGNTSVSTAPIAPTLGSLVVQSPKVANDPDFILTDPTSNSNGVFTFTSSDINVATIVGKTITLKAPGVTIITASQAANGAYSSGSTTASLTVLAAPETPIVQSLPYVQDFGASAFVDLPTGLVAWQTSVNYTLRTDAELSNPYTKANIFTRNTSLVTTLTPAGVIYGYGVPDAITTIANGSLGFLIKSANSPQVSMAFNTLAKGNINLKYDITVEKIGAIDAVAAQYRIGSTGVWTTLEGSIPDCSSLGLKSININLPAICSNQPYVQIRWITWYASLTSCIFTLDNISATSQGNLINFPTATNITHQSANLGATIADQAREVSSKGTVYNTQNGVTGSDNILAEGGTGVGAYAHIRNNLLPQTQYFFKGYGVTSSQTILSEEGGFRTLSAPALTATSNNSASVISNSQINLSWIAANFPVTGAGAKGYLVLRAIFPNVPGLSNVNGAIAVPDANSIIMNSLTSVDVSLNVIGLNSFTRYNFKIIPFTWDGINNTTLNYLTTGLVFDAITLPGPVSISTEPITNITSVSATTGSSFINDGGGIISSKGVVWGLSINPNVTGNKLESGTGVATYISNITNLIPQTQYFVRAYAENSAGIGYGDNVIFRTLSAASTVQASNFTAVGNNTSNTRIDLNWVAASFPTTGATVRGYALLYSVSPNIPTINNTNGQALLAGPNTFILSSALAANATTFTSSSLTNGISYNFILIPYTWDGTNTSTSNYLNTSAPRATSVKLPIVTASGPTSFCIGGEVTLTSNEPSGNTWFRNGTTINGANGVTYKATESGLYTVRTGTSTSLAMQVITLALPVPAITSTNGIKISKGFNTQLIANDGVTYQWSPNYRINDTRVANPIIQPDETTTYTVRVTNSNGCIATETITIEVLEDYKVSFQTLLTPNGDGKNDVWVIRNIESYPDNEVKVYDQSGREVFRKKRYDNSWEGTYNGSYLPKGTYPYVIYFGIDQNVIKGYLTILR